jgi:hypothetical protein
MVVQQRRRLGGRRKRRRMRRRKKRRKRKRRRRGAKMREKEKKRERGRGSETGRGKASWRKKRMRRRQAIMMPGQRSATKCLAAIAVRLLPLSCGSVQLSASSSPLTGQIQLSATLTATLIWPISTLHCARNPWQA